MLKTGNLNGREQDNGKFTLGVKYSFPYTSKGIYQSPSIE